MRPGLFCPCGLQSKGVPLPRGGLERREESAAQVGWMGGGKCLPLAPHSQESDSRGETHTSQVSPSPRAPEWCFQLGTSGKEALLLGLCSGPLEVGVGGGGTRDWGLENGSWTCRMGLWEILQEE